MFFLLVAFVSGTILGSFLNVVVLRFGTRALSGRSLCFSCGKTLRWFELIPVFSFLLQRGRCRRCKSHISWQYPLVELITGAVFAAVVYKNSQLTTLNLQLSELLTTYYILRTSLEWLIWSLLIALSIYDLRHKIIPNLLVYSFLSFSFLHPILSLSPFNFKLLTLNFGSGVLLALPFALIWLFSRGRAMGLGDAKLVLGFPWFVGWLGALNAVIVGFWIGAGVALFFLLLKEVLNFLPRRACRSLSAKLKPLTMKSELPLGPFLVLGLLIVYLWGVDVTGLSLLMRI